MFGSVRDAWNLGAAAVGAYDLFWFREPTRQIYGGVEGLEVASTNSGWPRSCGAIP